MPNWCRCKLTVSGPGVDEFLKACQGKPAEYANPGLPLTVEDGEEISKPEIVPFTFNALYPVPPEILAQGYNDAGYRWQVEHWGTKWDVNGNVDIYSQEDGSTLVEFDTAWSPPRPWVRHASKLFPELIFRLSYFEPGMMFCGCSIYKAGELIGEEYYEDDTQAFWNLVFNEFGFSRDDFFLSDDDDEPVEGSTGEIESSTA